MPSNSRKTKIDKNTHETEMSFLKRIIMISLIVIGCIITALSIHKAYSAEFALTDFDDERLIDIDGEDEGFLVKTKKYDLEGKDIALLEVENLTDNAYTILIKTYYTQADGKEMTVVKWFNDFPAGFKNYFVFKPGIRYTDFRYELFANPSTGDPNAELFVFDDRLSIESWPFTRDFYGKELDEQSTGLFAGLNYECLVSSDVYWEFKADVLIFGSDGELYAIKESVERNFEAGKNTSTLTLLLPGEIPWKDYKIPPELKGDVRAIVALKTVDVSDESYHIGTFSE